MHFQNLEAVVRMCSAIKVFLEISQNFAKHLRWLVLNFSIENLENNTELGYNSFEEKYDSFEETVLNLLSSNASFKKEWSREIKGYL